MGRKRRKDKDLPRRVYRKGRVYYYVTRQQKWIRLADNLPDMYRALADVEAGRFGGTLSDVFDRYEREVLPAKAETTQQSQRRQFGLLRPVFGQSAPDAVTPADIAAYLERRTAQVAANREIALLSHVFRKAIRWGLAERNPCQGVERNSESPDSRYIEDWEFAAVRAVAAKYVQIAMDLGFLTGQRQGDILSLKRSQLTPDGIEFAQSKTGARLVVVWSDELRQVIREAQGLESTIASVWVLHNRKGQRYTSSGFQTVWQRLQRRCVKEGIIKERFTFRAIRAKARTDGEDEHLLGHSNPAAMDRIYYRKPRKVRPVK